MEKLSILFLLMFFGGTLCSFVMSSIKFYNLAKLKHSLRAIGSDLPSEYLYLNSDTYQGIHRNTEDVEREIFNGRLAHLNDPDVNFLVDKVKQFHQLKTYCLMVGASGMIALFALVFT